MAQQRVQKSQPSSMGGVASGVAEAPIYNTQNRPVTAGGFVDKGPVIFEDITKQAGLAGWRHKMGYSKTAERHQNAIQYVAAVPLCPECIEDYALVDSTADDRSGETSLRLPDL